MSEEIERNLDFLTIYLPYSFIPDNFYVHDQLASLKINPRKGYSQCDLEVTKIILLQFLYMTIFGRHLKKQQSKALLDSKTLNLWSKYFVCKSYTKKALANYVDENWRKKLRH